MTKIRRIAMWSGPRNLSTAMMRSFSSRTDAWVWDEPFYAAYLDRVGPIHPMSQETLAAGERDPHVVAQRCLTDTNADQTNADQTRVDRILHYQKHLTHHMLDAFPLDWCDHVINVFLIRHPARVIASYLQKRAQVVLDDLGFEKQLGIFQRVQQRTGQTPVVLDSDRFILNPKAGLQALCASIGISYQSSMLTWPSGPHPDDGAWAPHWYDRVWRSTGFEAVQTSAGMPTLPTLDDHHQQMVDQALAWQQPLSAVALDYVFD